MLSHFILCGIDRKSYFKKGEDFFFLRGRTMELQGKENDTEEPGTLVENSQNNVPVLLSAGYMKPGY